MNETLLELDEIMEQENIELLEIKAKNCKSMSVLSDEGNCYIGIDKRDMSEAEEIVNTAHEVGHCVTGSFYNKYSEFDLISKHERRADIWAIKKLISKDELIDAFEHNILEIWELAEYFNLTEDFIRKACQYYGFLT